LKSKNLEDAQPYRYELKYVVRPEEIFLLESIIFSHSAGFRKAFPNRLVNNIYFDTIQLKAGADNLAGISNRTKLRYRWYDEELKGKLEFKIKKNALGSKTFIPLQNIGHLDNLQTALKDALPANQDLFPVLQNRYKRRYYIDASNKYRLTIDSDISYKIPDDSNQGLELTNAQFKNDHIILEIKFDQSSAHSESITSQIPFRLSKHSKYVTGLFGLYS